MSERPTYSDYRITSPPPTDAEFGFAEFGLADFDVVLTPRRQTHARVVGNPKRAGTHKRLPAPSQHEETP